MRITGSRRAARRSFARLWFLGLLTLLGQACSDNRGSAGPAFGAGEVGHADRTA